MVKGTTKKVIVVKSPDPRIFEQAIFIVREDFLSSKSPTDVLKEAERVANDYIRGSVEPQKKIWHRLPAPAFAAVGAVLTGIVWLSLHLAGIGF